MERGGGELAAVLVRKELAVTCSRPLFWILHTGLPLFLLAGTAVTWVGSYGFNPVVQESRIGLFSTNVMLAFSFCAYVGAVLVAPILTIGAVEDERRSGMLELLMVSPLSDRQILFSLIGGRLLTAVPFFVAASPLLVIPIWFGGTTLLGILVRAVVPVTFGAVLAAMYAVGGVVSGARLPVIWARLITFILCTPLRFGPLYLMGALVLPWFAGGAVALLVPDAYGRETWELASSFIAGACFPFWGLGILVLGTFPDTLSVGLGASLSALGAIGFLAGRAREGFSFWVRSQQQTIRHEGRTLRREPWGWRSVLERLRERSGSEEEVVAGQDTERPGEDAAARLSALTRHALGRFGRVERLVYRWSGHNPFVFRDLVSRRDPGGTLLFCFVLGLFFVFAAALVPELRRAGGSDPAPPPITALVVANASVAIAYSTARQAAGLLPTRAARGFSEALLSTPLSAWDFILGGFATVFLRAFPILVALLILIFAPLGTLVSVEGSGGILCCGHGYVLLWAALPLIYALALWTGAVFPGRTERTAISFVIAVVFLTAPAILAPAGSPVSRLHPIAVWFRGCDPSPSDLILGAGTLVGTAALLLVGFALAFRSLMRP